MKQIRLFTLLKSLRAYSRSTETKRVSLCSRLVTTLVALICATTTHRAQVSPTMVPLMTIDNRDK